MSFIRRVSTNGGFTVVLIGVGVYKYDAKQLAAGEEKQQDAQPLLEERTLGSATQVELVDDNDMVQTKCENEEYR